MVIRIISQHAHVANIGDNEQRRKGIDMNKTEIRIVDTDKRVTVNTETLAGLFDCGRATAVKIGDAAGARITFGRRVLWNMDKVREYLAEVSK